MKTTFSAVAAQGAGAEQNSYASNSATFKGKYLPKIGLNLLLSTVLLAGFLCIFFPTTLIAQTPDTLDVDSFDFVVVAPSRFIEAYQPVSLYILLGKSSAQVNDALDFDIELELDEEVLFPTQPDIDLASSWFFDTTAQDTTVSLNSTAKTIRLEGHQTTAATGYGLLYQLTVVTGPNGIHGSQIVVQGGGVVVVEDLGFKRKEETPTPSVSAQNFQADFEEPVLYPNPCYSQLNFDWQGEMPQRVQLLSINGQMVEEVSPEQLEARKLAVDRYAPGLYKAVMFYENHAPVTQTIHIN